MNSKELIGKSIHEADTPALLLDIDALKANIAAMAAFFKDKHSRLRPHFKSHKCTSIAKLQMQDGAVGITCAKLGEAEAVADAGIRDILIANQIVSKPKIKRLIELAKKSDPMVAVDSAENIKALSSAASEVGVKIRILVEVDCGMNRCGVQPGQPALDLARLVIASPGLVFEGLQGYEGHLVQIRDVEDRFQQTRDALAPLIETRRLIEGAGIPVNIVSGGGTGTYNLTGCLEGIDEVQAGSYACMDYYYGEIRPEFKQAMSVLVGICSRVVPGVAVVDVGTKGIGADFGPPMLKNTADGELMKFSSEEHTIFYLKESAGSIGDSIEIIPSHGCATATIYHEFLVHKDGIIVDVWPIEGAGKLQ